MNKVFIVGNGFIASHLNYPIIPERIPASSEGIKKILEQYKPSVLINCLAFCGYKNIDDCEIEKDKTLECNLTIPTMLATECQKLGIHFISIGSGCIYYGKSPNFEITNEEESAKYVDARPQYKDLGWKETDNPKLENASFYSKIKYAADLAIGNLDNSCILRIRMPISNKNLPRNLINKLLNYTDIVEIPNSITMLSDLVRVIDWVIQNEKKGIWHITNPEPLTHVELLAEYQKYKNFSFNKISEKELNNLVKANRSNCIINSDKLKISGFEMTPTKEALKDCMREFVRAKHGI